jgi:tryptophan-rich sensory protein
MTARFPAESPAPAPLRPAGSSLSLLYLGLAVGLVSVTAVAGSVATQKGLTGWYQSLNKPWFTPPNIAFPVAWTLLFGLMAYGFWRVLRLPEKTPGRRKAIVAFLAQLVLNAAWSVAFFGMRSPLAGLVVIVPLLAGIAQTLLSFWRLDRTAGLTFVPYLGWVSFAALLNATILAMN